MAAGEGGGIIIKVENLSSAKTYWKRPLVKKKHTGVKNIVSQPVKQWMIKDEQMVQ
jgi:hypothetical protein